LCKLSFLRDFFSLFFANLRQKTGLKKYFLFFADFALTSAFLWPYTDFIKRSGFFWGSAAPSLRAGSPAHPGRCMPSRPEKETLILCASTSLFQFSMGGRCATVGETARKQ
jgi:hypothetical protein